MYCGVWGNSGLSETGGTLLPHWTTVKKNISNSKFDHKKPARGSCAGCMWLSQRRRESCRKQTCNLHSPGRGEEETGALWAGSIWAIVPARPRFREARAPSGSGLIDQRSMFSPLVAACDQLERASSSRLYRSS